MLGIFLLGMLTKRATSRSALAGAGTGLVIVFGVSSLTQVSWLWYGFVGCCSTFLVGCLSGTSNQKRDIHSAEAPQKGGISFLDETKTLRGK
jgi:Na+/proline symporter